MHRDISFNAKPTKMLSVFRWQRPNSLIHLHPQVQILFSFILFPLFRSSSPFQGKDAVELLNICFSFTEMHEIDSG